MQARLSRSLRDTGSETTSTAFLLALCPLAAMCSPEALKTALLPASAFPDTILAFNMFEVPFISSDTTCCVTDVVHAATAMCHACHRVMCSACTRYVLTPANRDTFVKEVMHAQKPGLYRYIMEKVACRSCAYDKECPFPSRVTKGEDDDIFLPYIRVVRPGDKKPKPADGAHPPMTRKPEMYALPSSILEAMQAFSLGAATDVKVRPSQNPERKQACRVQQGHWSVPPLQTPEEEKEEPPQSPPPPSPAQHSE